MGDTGMPSIAGRRVPKPSFLFPIPENKTTEARQAPVHRCDKCCRVRSHSACCEWWMVFRAATRLAQIQDMIPVVGAAAASPSTVKSLSSQNLSLLHAHETGFVSFFKETLFGLLSLLLLLGSSAG